MPPMWTVPLRVMAGFALAAGGDGPAPVRRSAPGGRVARGFAAGGDGVGAVARSGCPGHLAGVLGLLPGDAPGQALVGALGVVDVVEAVDPSPGGSAMESARGCRPGWRSRVWPKRSLSPVGGGPVGSAGGGFDAQGAHVPRPGGPVTPRRLGLRAAPLSAARAPGARPGRLRPCRRRRWPPDWSRPGRPGRPPPGGSGRPGAGQVTALRPPARTYSVASSCQQALGAGQVEPAPRRPRSLGRFGPGHPLLTEDPGQGRRRGRLEAHGGHLVVHADRTVVRSRAPPEPRAHRGPGREPDRAGGSGRHRGRRDRGSSTAAGPSSSARRRKT